MEWVLSLGTCLFSQSRTSGGIPGVRSSLWLSQWIRGYRCLSALYLTAVPPRVELLDPQDCDKQAWIGLKQLEALQMFCLGNSTRVLRSTTEVGLQTYTNYDLRVQETCIHNTSDSWWAQKHIRAIASRVQGTALQNLANMSLDPRSVFAGWEFVYHPGCDLLLWSDWQFFCTLSHIPDSKLLEIL